MRYRNTVVGCAAVMFATGSAIAQEAPAPSARVRIAQLQDEQESLSEQQKKVAGELDELAPKKSEADDEGDKGSFAGLKLGVGLSFTLDVGKLARISEAEIKNGIVRVTDQNNGRARIMLESHYFFTPCGRFLGMGGSTRNDDQKLGDGRCTSDDPDLARWGYGPFVAIQPGSGEIIDAIGAGLMVGFRRKGSQSFNIGVGIVIDPNTRVLGDGFTANAAPPAGEETAVRYRETLQTGVLILTSFSF